MAIKDAQGNDIRIGDTVAVATRNGANQPVLHIGVIVAIDHDRGEHYLEVHKADPRHLGDYCRVPIADGVASTAVKYTPPGVFNWKAAPESEAEE